MVKENVLESIKKSLTKDDETWEEIEVIPFSNKLPEIKNKKAFNIVYGSTTLMLNAYQDMDYRRGVFYDPGKFQMKNYVSNWGKHVLNYSGRLIKLKEINQIKNETENRWFIRPNHDGKEFSGQVDTYDNLKKWSEKIIALRLPDFNEETEIWIAKPQIIDKEWRLFIIDNKIVSASKYLEKGELNESSIDLPKEMLDFAQERINEYKLAEVYVMDVAKVKGEYKIIECNCFNGTGFYDHDIGKIVNSINTLIRKKLNSGSK